MTHDPHSMTLAIGRRATVQVLPPTLEEASRLYNRMRDESGEGASTWPTGKIRAAIGGRIVTYHVSYNGRVWDRPDGRVVQEAVY